MTYYSPGVEYFCPRCESNSIRFIFDNKANEIWKIAELIHMQKVELSQEMSDYYSNLEAPKWLCYGCYNCGVVLC